MPKHKFIATILLLLSAMHHAAADEPTDSLPLLEGGWVKQLMAAKFDINDPRINYPKFPKFCVDAYNWINTYDPSYVIDNGKNWKATLYSYNWNQSFNYVFDQFSRDLHGINIVTTPNSDVGVSIDYLAFGLSYAWNVNQWFTGNKSPRSTFNLSINCARFCLEYLYQESEGDAIIRRFGRYNDGHKIAMSFDGISIKQTTVQGYYFLNNKRYSQAAAYAFSKYQLRSAGSAILGLSYGRRDINLDFSTLPFDMLEAMPMPLKHHFQYDNYNLLFGYGYNVVLHKKWLLNITGLPSIGYRHSYLQNYNHNTRQMMSTNVTARGALVFNHGPIFLSMNARSDAAFLFNTDYSFFNTVQTVNLIAGVLF